MYISVLLAARTGPFPRIPGAGGFGMIKAKREQWMPIPPHTPSPTWTLLYPPSSHCLHIYNFLPQIAHAEYILGLSRSRLCPSHSDDYRHSLQTLIASPSGPEKNRKTPHHHLEKIAKMPGILPMKVIKVGSNAQARIAQACDRCRSKKIRCDGIRPSCSQCVNVGFECKTSDKLSRRAFPRGYTESLEERVRFLEGEVRELKDLLDEKDEKIDMLSRIHSHTSQAMSSPPRPSTQSPLLSPENREDSQDKEDIFKVQQSPLLLDDENSDLYFVGTSSGRTLIGRNIETGL